MPYFRVTRPGHENYKPGDIFYHQFDVSVLFPDRLELVADDDPDAVAVAAPQPVMDSKESSAPGEEVAQKATITPAKGESDVTENFDYATDLGLVVVKKAKKYNVYSSVDAYLAKKPLNTEPLERAPEVMAFVENLAVHAGLVKKGE